MLVHEFGAYAGGALSVADWLRLLLDHVGEPAAEYHLDEAAIKVIAAINAELPDGIHLGPLGFEIAGERFEDPSREIRAAIEAVDAHEILRDHHQDAGATVVEPGPVVSGLEPPAPLDVTSHAERARYTCGHIIRPQRPGESGRAARCRRCRDHTAEEIHEIILSRVPLPRLTGSPRQVQWAYELLKARLHHGLVVSVRGDQGKPEQVSIHLRMEELGYGYYGYNLSEEEAVKKLIAAVWEPKRRRAEWWISRRGMSTLD